MLLLKTKEKGEDLLFMGKENTEVHITKSQRRNNRFGGIIYESDFCTNFGYESGKYAKRIKAAMNFDNWCMQNSKIKNNKNSEKEQ